jgi:hypothetical protein
VGKRSEYERVSQDLYQTSLSAVTVLLRWLEPAKLFVEPCIGRGALARHILFACYDLPDDAREALRRPQGRRRDRHHHRPTGVSRKACTR